MEPIKVDVNNLNDEQKRADRFCRAHDSEVANFKLVDFEEKAAGSYFLIYERTPQFHDWFNVTIKLEGDITNYSIQKVPHMGWSLSRWISKYPIINILYHFSSFLQQKQQCLHHYFAQTTGRVRSGSKLNVYPEFAVIQYNFNEYFRL